MVYIRDDETKRNQKTKKVLHVYPGVFNCILFLLPHKRDG